MVNLALNYIPVNLGLSSVPGRITADQGVVSSIPALPNTFMEMDHEIISTAISSHPLIQEGLFLVTSESMCTKYWLFA